MKAIVSRYSGVNEYVEPDWPRWEIAKQAAYLTYIRSITGY